jgi:adenosine deaminase
MAELTMLKHLVADDKSLSTYFSGQVNFDELFQDVRRRLFLLERNSNRNVPDHHYRLQQEIEFDDIDSVGTLLTKGLHKLAAEHLELYEKKVFVKVSKQNHWQELITYIPPLILVSSFLQEHFPIVDFSETGLKSYFNNYILPNAKYTALPHPKIAELQQYLDSHSGLHDLHIHLNGSTETDLAWQDFLGTPQRIRSDVEDGFTNLKVKEQFEQESHLLDPDKFYKLLLAARKIRRILFDFIHPGEAEIEYQSQQHLLAVILRDNVDHDSAWHPFQQLVNIEDNYEFNMAVEGLMYVLVLQRLKQQPRDSIAWMLHFYLLILGLSNRLLVQQTHQYGFEQFQKHTLNNLRAESERQYRKRFFQMHGNQETNIKFLEGRFSPQRKEKDTIDLVDNIYQGWGKLVERAKENLLSIPELKLTAHFIKKHDKHPNDFFRFYDLRKDVWDRALVLSYITNSYPTYQEKILGVDAAASEFDTPPEVFAPAFRMLRRKGIKHFTYHAGEDFFHVISGLRAIFEAVTFTEMKIGDRIGHATASGILVERWREVIGSKILMRKGEWLDNLVFVHYLIDSNLVNGLSGLLKSLSEQIEKYSFDIYEERFPVRVLEDAWGLRKYCPIQLLGNDHSKATIESVYDYDEWAESNREIGVRDTTNPIYRAIEKYHTRSYRDRYDKIISVELTDFPDKDIPKLQLGILNILHEKEIVIETLPTSNVRIGYYKDYSQYHLLNWLRWEEMEHAVPHIVVGSDDTGIFATNIYNEYANIYCFLVGQGITPAKAMAYIERLDKNGSIYKFA